MEYIAFVLSQKKQWIAKTDKITMFFVLLPVLGILFVTLYTVFSKTCSIDDSSGKSEPATSRSVAD